MIASTGCAVELGVVEAVEQVDAAGAGGGEADAEPAGVLGVAAGHERRRLLVPHLDEADLVLALAQRLHDAVDAVAGQAEDDVDAPVVQGVDQKSAAVFAMKRSLAGSSPSYQAASRSESGTIAR